MQQMIARHLVTCEVWAGYRRWYGRAAGLILIGETEKQYRQDAAAGLIMIPRTAAEAIWGRVLEVKTEP